MVDLPKREEPPKEDSNWLTTRRIPRSPVFLNVISLVIESTRRFAPPPSRGQDPEQKEAKNTKCLRKRNFVLFAPSCLIRALVRQKTKEKIERRRPLAM